ncbi:MAG: hypothetical protein ACFCU6_02670 [Balneolaceae bacterium]
MIWYGCDSTSLPPDEDPVLIRNLVIIPSEITFQAEDGIRDTTITIQMKAEAAGFSEENPVQYSILRNGSEEITGFFSSTGPGNEIEANVQISLSTTSFETWRLFVFGFNNLAEGEVVEGKIVVRGISTQPPQIVEAFNTESVKIPSEGQEQISFFARVVHPVNQTLIDRVEFFLIDQNGNRLGGPGTTFEMFDDGVINIEEGRIDEAANDSLYSRALFINPNNQPDNVDVFYFATDISGLKSDTLQTTLEIRE